ncbi:diacylglycerol kinase [Fibrobacterales bacterium]|nr:diacylglycerol kinase [Fibrobacterales bacterium]
MQKFHFLINPVSGGGQGKTVFDFLPEIMRSMDFKEVEWEREFSIRGKFEEQIRDALADTECLIAVGGDGTAAAVFQVLLHSPEFENVKIGLIPLGTGNDLARVLGLYYAFVNKGLLFSVRKLLTANAKKMDLWKVSGGSVENDFAMANYFSAGIDARIAHDFNRDRIDGKIAGNSVFANKFHYVKRFFADRKYRLQSGELRITDVNGEEKNFELNGNCTVIIGNIPSFAGGSNPFGKSDMSDGILEVLRIPNLGSFVKSLSVFGAGNLVIKARSVELRLAKDEFIQLDGEDFKGHFEMPVKIEFGRQINILHL